MPNYTDEEIKDLELTPEDLEWLEKYGGDPEFSGDGEVVMNDEPYPEDPDADDKATKLAKEEEDRKAAEEALKQKSEEEAKAQTDADSQKPTESDAAQKKALEDQAALDEAAEQKLYAELLELNDKNDGLTESIAETEKQLSEKEKSLTDLAKKFDDGEIKQGEYDISKAKLADEITGIKSELKELKSDKEKVSSLLEDTAKKVDAVAEAANKREAEAKSESEKLQGQWIQSCNAFLAKPENKAFVDNPELQDELGQFVGTIAKRMANKGVKISNDELLMQARKAVCALHEDIPKSPEKPQDKTKPKKEQPAIPRTLGHLSAAANPEASKGNDDLIENWESMSPQERDKALLAMDRNQLKEWAKRV